MENLTVELTPEETALIMVTLRTANLTMYPVLTRAKVSLTEKLNKLAEEAIRKEGYGKANFDPNRDALNFLDETDGYSRGSESNS